MNWFVEGLQGSGKSTLTRRIAELRPESVPVMEGFADDILLFPEFGYFPLAGNKIHVCRNWLIHGYSSDIRLICPGPALSIRRRRFLSHP